MKPAGELKGFKAFMDDNDDTVSFVSGRLSGTFGACREPEEFQEPGNAADARRKSELQSLLLMASLMLGDRAAAV
jgi:hypothetical protein